MEDPTLHDVLGAINEYAAKNDQQWAKNEERWTKNDDRWAKTDALLDKLTVAVVELQEQGKKTNERLDRFEELGERTYRRIDDFLHKMDVHEAEIMANRAAYQRLEERVTILEQKLAY